MKWILALIFILACSISAFAFQNEPDGFRGIKWGTDISDIPYLVFKRDYSQDFGGIKIYTNRDDSLKIGGADVSEIEYYFWGGKFYKMSASTSDLLKSGELYYACLDQFGDRMDIIGSTYRWKGTTTEILLSERGYSGNFIWIESTTLSNKLSDLEKQKRVNRSATGF